jgi:predicted RNA-binding Zn-ribbon protein involved in translation (DUF1610 family)
MSAQPVIPRNDYREKWRSYMRLRKLILFMWIGWIPMLAAYILLIRMYGSISPAFLGSYLVLHYAVGIIEAFWPCPRCGRTFSTPSRYFWRGSGFQKGLPRVCVHCGLPRFAADDRELPPSCPKCGFPAIGRFCTNCGAPQNAAGGSQPGNSVPR